MELKQLETASDGRVIDGRGDTSSADPAKHQPERSWSRFAWAIVYVAVAAAAVSLLPTLLPVAPSVSGSYMFGYNNRAGIALLLAFVLGAALWLRNDPLFDLGPDPISRRIPRSTLAATLALALVCCALMYFFTARFNGFIDSAYFIERIQQARDGHRLYKDFDFAYGPVLIYLPMLIARVGNLSTTNAYFLFWIFTVLSGLVMLYATINLVELPSRHKRSIFLLFTLFSLPAILDTGTNGNYFRFAPAALFALLTCRAFSAAGRQGIPAAAYLRVVIFSAVLLSISPELGISFAVGSSIFLAVFMGRVSFRSLAAYLLMLFALALLFVSAGRLGEFDTVKQFGRGGYNLPILPAPHILFFAAALFLTCCFVIRSLRSRGGDKGLLFVLAAVAPLLVGALSICDAPHLGFNGFGILLVSAFYACRLGFWRPFKVAFVLCLVIGPAIGVLWNDRGIISRSVFVALPQADGLLVRVAVKLGKNKDVIRKRLDTVRASTMLPQHLALETLYPHATGVVDAPFAYSPNVLGNYLSPEIMIGRYHGIENIVSSGQVGVKIEELRTSARPLLLPADFPDTCNSDPQEEKRLIRLLFLFPYTARVRHSENLLEPLCDFIASNYRMADPATTERWNYSLWVPR